MAQHSQTYFTALYDIVGGQFPRAEREKITRLVDVNNFHTCFDNNQIAGAH